MSRPGELLTDYAHGALSAAETVRLEEHLSSCASCRGEVRDVREGFVELVEGLPRVQIPTGVWVKVLSRIRGQRVRAGRRLAWGLAASLVLMAASGFWGFQALENAAQADLESQTVARWLSREDVSRVSLGIYPSGGYGSVLLLPNGRTLFVLSDSPARGNSYQAWGRRGDEIVSLGVFNRPVFETTTTGYEAIGVSLEPRGGSPEPTHTLGRAELPGP
ncbi:MAG: anti-sigma factor [Trueperaceae bacterium]